MATKSLSKTLSPLRMEPSIENVTLLKEGEGFVDWPMA